jgi:hypothetical protein
MLVTEASAGSSPPYTGSALEAVPRTTEYGTWPSTTKPSTLAMVTVWGTYQLPGVKVRVAVETVPSVVSLELTGMVTAAAGLVVSTTRNAAPELPSVVTRPVRLVTLTPGPGRTTTSPPS